MLFLQNKVKQVYAFMIFKKGEKVQIFEIKPDTDFSGAGSAKTA
jgi:hypothetical protein